MKRSSSSSARWRGEQPRGSRVPLRYHEPGRQEKVILWNQHQNQSVKPQLYPFAPNPDPPPLPGHRSPSARPHLQGGHLMTPEVWFRPRISPQRGLVSGFSC